MKTWMYDSTNRKKELQNARSMIQCIRCFSDKNVILVLLAPQRSLTSAYFLALAGYFFPATL